MAIAELYSPPRTVPLVSLLSWERRTALVGLLATAVTFGPARMAYGMLLPSLRETFGLSGSTAGVIAAASFAAFALALVLASLATRTSGAKLPVVVGGVAALGGAALVAIAQSTWSMALGVVVAAASAGLCWTPFNAVAGRLVRPHRRDRVLSMVSTGTTLGIAAMALGALALAWTGASWRIVWVVTGAAGMAVAALAFALLPPSHRLVPRTRPDVPPLDTAELARRLGKCSAWPIYALAVMFGTVSAVFGTFAVDHVAGAMHVDGGSELRSPLVPGGLVFLAYGAGGTLGFATDAIERRLGLRTAFAASFAALALGTGSLALVPESWVLTLGGAGLVGAGVMVFCVLLAVATLRAFPALPVVGFTAGVIAMSLGSVMGPIAAGWLADTWGTGLALLSGAIVAVVAAWFPFATTTHRSETHPQGRPIHDV